MAIAQLAADAAATRNVTPPPTPGPPTAYAGAQTRTAPAVSEHNGASVLEPTAQPAQAAYYSTVKPEKKEPQLHRFHGSVNINARMMAGDAGKIMEEVVKHLTTLCEANVQVTLEIQATIPGGVPEGTVCTVTENCRTLKFESFGFEEE